ncbi:hypothetical protein F4804DRAFT_312443 [Jackrogersella minutella]|nr:hypothetical protein F4804DRAFT_312443 [Jackrogersella minutella]
MVPTTPTQLATLILAVSSLGLSSAGLQKKRFGPMLDSARKNGPQIFNSVHDAMREFGSAFHHNGMSLYPAVIPKGVLLYHGTDTKEVPKGLEWLAFEIEHAEGFARGRWRHPNDTDRKPRHPGPPPGPPGPPVVGGNMLLQDQDRPPKSPPFESNEAGHLHIYQAERPLNVVYIDGMAAGKTDMGTVDTQDILLGGNSSRLSWDDWSRADNLCDFVRNWNIDGVIRMEPGFEVIYCDFTDGLRLISTNKRPSMDKPGSEDGMQISGFEWARAASQRYNDIGSSRVVLDYSSVVSAFFYPINLTNPDPERPELPRLLGASAEELAVVREHIAESVARSISHIQAPIDWQGVTDMIVTRYAKRLALISQTDSIDIIRAEINGLLNVYIDYDETDGGLVAARQRCTEFYFQPVQPRTSEDKLIYAAFENTTATVCKALFKARQLTIEDPDADESAAVAATKQTINDLMDTLSWSVWKDCGACQPDEVCFIAMWPMGNVEDHYNPSCQNYSSIRGRNNYWRFPGRTPVHRPPPPSPCANDQLCGEDRGLTNEEL